MVSVIIPAYNSGNTTVKAIRSVLFQTYTKWSIVIVDDGSKDDTFEVIKMFLDSLPKSDSEKIILYRQQNQGPSAARNSGVKLALGEYIAFLDSDDEWEANKLEVQMNYLEKDSSLYLCAAAFGKKRIQEQLAFEYISFDRLLFKNLFSTPTVIVKAEVFEKFTFDFYQKYGEDYKMWLQIAYEYKCIYINSILAKNQFSKKDFGEVGLSANLWKMEAGELSNYLFLYKCDKIDSIKLIRCSVYSLLKYALRVFKSTLVKLRK
jgi:glycosyltransferase involved in cell wall biosynthesis